MIIFLLLLPHKHVHFIIISLVEDQSRTNHHHDSQQEWILIGERGKMERKDYLFTNCTLNVMIGEEVTIVNIGYIIYR